MSAIKPTAKSAVTTNARTLAALGLAALLGLSLSARPAHAQDVYVSSSTGEPWGASDNINAMNDAFGAGKWQHDNFESASPSALFAPANKFIFMDGSCNGSQALANFLGGGTASAQMTQWVNQGGSLFINDAPNAGPQDLSLGFGATMNWDNFSHASSSATAASGQTGDAIFTGTGLYGKAGTTWTGGYFAHSIITGSGLTTLIAGSAGTVLAEKNVGAGHVYFGGMTMPEFHQPAQQAFDLRVNLLEQGAKDANATPAPEPSSVAAFAFTGLGAAGLILKARKRRA